MLLSTRAGAVETTRPTTHSEPVYVVDGSLHYCVANMPGIVPSHIHTRFTNATLPLHSPPGSEGVDQAIRSDPGLAKGVNSWMAR